MAGNGLRIVSTSWIAACFGVALAAAHQHPCPHFHEPSNPDRLISCTQSNAACTQGGNGGNCKQIQEFSSAWCECKVAGGGGGGSLSLGVYFFDAQGFGPPSPNSGPIYLATGDAVNAATVVVGNGPGVDFDDQQEFVTGTFSVFFPVFAPGDTEVVVTLEDVSLGFAAIGGSGTNFVALADGQFQDLVYDDTTGILEPLDPAGMLIHIDNAFFTDLPVRLFFEGRYRPNGDLDVTFQHVSVPQLFADGVEWGDFRLWSMALPATAPAR
jgi:hypothetical protein